MAADLIGAEIVSAIGGGVVRGRVVETEAYLGFDDPASHAFRGRRHAGNAGIYSPPGCWYVYRCYGLHWCANLVVGGAGDGAAVLLRAVVIDAGEAVATSRRQGVARARLSDGPGKLCQALGIDRELDGRPMAGSPVTLVRGPPVGPVAVTPRIGISKAVDWPLRFLESKTAPR